VIRSAHIEQRDVRTPELIEGTRDPATFAAIRMGRYWWTDRSEEKRPTNGTPVTEARKRSVTERSNPAPDRVRTGPGGLLRFDQAETQEAASGAAVGTLAPLGVLDDDQFELGILGVLS